MKREKKRCIVSWLKFLKGCAVGGAGIMLASQLGKHTFAQENRKPNIILIMADDLGYGDLGCYGQEEIHTPNIDRMATEGIRFTNFYSGSTVCAPSRCVLMTGLHTGHSYIRGNREVKPMGQLPIPAETVTVGEILKNAGYATGIIGKWGLGGPGSTGIPNKQGFDYFYGYLCQRHAHNYYPEFLFRNTERVRLEGNKVAKPWPDGAGVAVQRTQYSHDLFTREALAFIERNKDKPFFQYLAYTIPHANCEAGRKGMEVPSLEPYTNEDWPEPEKGFAAMVTRMDSDIGKLLAKLRKLGIDKNTLVFFTSDNGPHKEGGQDPLFFNSADALRGIKRDLYEGGIRVPMIARWPGKVRPGTVNSQPFAFWDFLPTAAELAGVKAPRGIDGISIVPALLGKEQRNHVYLYWEFHERGFHQAVRMGKWKAVRFGMKEPIELYNLEDDIGETDNIADEYPDVVAKIEGILQTARTDSEQFPIREKD